MSENLIGFIDGFRAMKVLVIGEAMLDSYLSGETDRLCREAPVPVVTLTGREHLPGGAANTAVNLQSMGAQAIFLSVIGDDAEGELLCRALEEQGVSSRHLIKEDRRTTLSKQRVIAGSQIIVRVDQGSTGAVQGRTERALIKRLEAVLPEVDAVVISDYSYGVLTPRVIEALGRLQDCSPRTLVLDSRRLAEYRGLKISAVKPNYDEALRLLGLQQDGSGETSAGERVRRIEAEGSRVLDLCGAEMAAVTMDRDGALLFRAGAPPYRTYARPRPNSHATGAGDTFVSALALALAAGATPENAVELASAAAEIVVSKDGTATCSAEELRTYFTAGEKFVADAFQLTARVAAYRREGLRIIFTNGCFDILHGGHINYLNQAKALGDVLIVGVNSDESVRRLKGAGRPINTLQERAEILAALSSVDHIVPFGEDTPSELIKIVRPDVFVKGGDYTRETLPEAALVESLGGEIHLLPYLENHSTTSIIERIRTRLVAQELPAGGGSPPPAADLPHRGESNR